MRLSGIESEKLYPKEIQSIIFRAVSSFWQKGKINVPQELANQEQHMVTRASAEISRRQFLAAGGLAAATACLAPTALIAQSDDALVPGALKEAATAEVTVQALRRNISVLLGAGGNIAVLTGPDGKLLVDAEIVTARPRVSAALARINADPIKQLINTHWHFDHTGGNGGYTKPKPVSWHKRIRAIIFQKRRASKVGSTLSRPHRRARSLQQSSKRTTLCTRTAPL